jgi:hypothetical protein
MLEQLTCFFVCLRSCTNNYVTSYTPSLYASVIAPALPYLLIHELVEYEQKILRQLLNLFCARSLVMF